MSACLTKLMDSEKYLLAEMVYYHLPPEIAKRDFENSPLPLCEMIDMIPWCESGGANPKGADGTDAAYMRRAHMRLRRMYASHPKLHDLCLTGYVNDNFGQYATTDEPGGTSFVAMGFRDGNNCRVVVYSGCETRAFRPMLKDYGDCLVAVAGVTTKQHSMALDFYDAQMAAAAGERGVIGHSKGGNLATHVFVNRLTQPLSAYCINAQPYCWWILNGEQRAALKSGRYEFIVHEGDVVYHTGYASYVSRIVQVNPFLSRRSLASLHGFCHMRFDSMGNLEGNRILRTTRRSLGSRIFGDDLEETPPTREDVIANFQRLMALDIEPARLLSIALEELCIAAQVDTAALMLRVIGDLGDMLYVYQAKGDGAQLLRDLRIRVSGSDELLRIVSSGLPVYAGEARRYEQHFAPFEGALGFGVSSACVIPIGDEERPWLGALELLRKDGMMTVEDFELGVELTGLIGKLRQRINTVSEVKDRPLLRLTRSGTPLIELTRHAYREKTYRFDAERAAYLRLFSEGLLANDEALVFDGWEMGPEDRSLLKNWRRKGVAVIGRDAALPGRFDAPEKGSIYEGVTAEIASTQMGFRDKSLEWLKTKAQETLQTGGDEGEGLRARTALCLMRRPPLIVFDTAGCAPEAARELCAYLKLLCYDKLATVLVLKAE